MRDVRVIRREVRLTGAGYKIQFAIAKKNQLMLCSCRTVCSCHLNCQAIVTYATTHSRPLNISTNIDVSGRFAITSRSPPRLMRVTAWDYSLNPCRPPRVCGEMFYNWQLVQDRSSSEVIRINCIPGRLKCPMLPIPPRSLIP